MKKNAACRLSASFDFLSDAQRAALLTPLSKANGTMKEEREETKETKSSN
jgi:hypothetical protein